MPNARAKSMLFRKQRPMSNDSSHDDLEKMMDKTDYFLSFRGGSNCANNNTVRGDEVENGGDSKQQAATSTTSPTSAATAYYLIWSPGFAKKFALATAILTLLCHLYEWDYLRFFAKHSSLSGSAMFCHPSLISNLVMPLLSSSCCAIQLLINAVSALIGAGAGCVGFNSVLGPLRPYLLAAMLVFTTTTGRPSTLGSIAGLMVRYSIALLPEVVFWRNEIVRTNWRNQKRRSSGETTTAAAAAAAEKNTSIPLLRATLIVDVPTMGCVACINKIESSLRQCSPKNIDGATSWLNEDNNNNIKMNGKKGGRARIEVCAESKEELDSVTQSVIGVIENAGFRGTTVQSLDVNT
eukprot:CAMPEP_0168187408 /NCGR_PEP_ID=MMETSP0139_2-20121125/15011_1 /TAXON_ID=44445 /ORGANISM="Pseudo-nitzschia australis, Strain 10249 10 AB" /LENGTH=351 /DNA_ID=CAMNT_0008109603 /DNA_START=254 /DNA_END=1309 /DNA_ORIENTATION=+